MGLLLLSGSPSGPPVTPGIGPAGAATFVLSLEAGAKITLTFATEVEKAWDGTEQRVALWGCPRQKYDATAYLIGSELRTLRPQLTAAATAQPFLVGLPHEELMIAGAGGLTVPVTSTALCDWALAGQRVVVVGTDGRTFLGGVVQSATGTTITLDTNVSSIAVAGARIMPAMAVYLDPQQGVGRYPVNVGEWHLAATSVLFGFGGVDTMGVGATITLSADGRPVWDRGVEFLGQASSDSIQSLTEVIDYGGVLSAAGGAPAVDWGRQVAIESASRADWQWFKAFIAGVRGRQLMFLLPTGHSDILYKAKVSDTVITVFGSPTAGAGDPRSVFLESVAHQWLAILCTNGTTLYADISSIGDNGDGTCNIAFGLASLSGRTPSKISWAENCRFESDDFETTWADSTFAYNGLAHVVQEE